MGRATGDVLSQHPDATPMFLVVLVVLAIVGYRYRHTLLVALGMVLGGMSTGTVVGYSLFSLTGARRFGAFVQTSFAFGASIVHVASRLLDAVVVGSLMAFATLAQAAWTGVTWLLRKAAIPGITANEFLLLILTYQFVAGVVLVYGL